MRNAFEFVRKNLVTIGLVAVIIVLAGTGSYRESTRLTEPKLTPENVARFYAAGETGLVIRVVGSPEDVSVEFGVEEAYRFTVTADGFEGEAQIVVAKSKEGGWVVVPQQAPNE